MPCASDHAQLAAAREHQASVRLQCSSSPHPHNSHADTFECDVGGVLCWREIQKVFCVECAFLT